MSIGRHQGELLGLVTHVIAAVGWARIMDVAIADPAAPVDETMRTPLWFETQARARGWTLVRDADAVIVLGTPAVPPHGPATADSGVRRAAMTILLACPFCDSLFARLAVHTCAGSESASPWHWHVRCGSCQAEGPAGDTRTAAEAAWNAHAWTRTPASP